MLERVLANVERVIIGKRQVIRLLLAALLADGHVLLEDVPGLGKTTLARALARSLDCRFRRIQFTPDLMPTDITGVNVFLPSTQGFEFRPGPVMTEVLLADEINRATPRTQSALLEAMEERQVTVDGETRPLPRPFLVLATQNPVELHGTFPLPEAQLDRFLMRLDLGYPGAEEEREMVRRFTTGSPLDALEPVLPAGEVRALQTRTRRVHVAEPIGEYLTALVRATRSHPAVALGASPRATLGLCRAAQAIALLDGRDYVLPDDVKAVARPVLNHRLVLTGQDRIRGETPGAVLDELLATVPVPVED